ncbi:hypothetical protein SprV_0602178000 [Sparganum proliferum]
MKKRAELNDKLQSLLCPTDKCSMSARVVNLSKRSLTPAEISLLSKGLKFNHTDAAPTNFLASLESVLLASAIPEDVRADIRSCASGLLRQRKRHRNLTVDEEKGLRSLKTDDSIVIVPADKGGATVIMDKVDYVQKANTVFNDREAYAPLAEDPTKKQAAVIKKKVNELARLKLINPNDSKFMTLSDPRIAHAYGLPKVHKPDAPLRIIVPLIGSPTYNLAKWLYRHLKHLADGSQYSITNSQAFLEKIEGLKGSILRQQEPPAVSYKKSNGIEMVQLPTDILREKLADVDLPEGESDLLKDDSMLWRYLKARNGNIDEAQKMIRKSIEWRRTYKPHTIDCQWCHERPGLHSLRQVGFDEAGRPVLYSSFTQAATSKNTAAEAIAHLTYVLENAVRSMPEGVSQWVLVFDCSDWKKLTETMNSVLTMRKRIHPVCTD